MLIGCRGDITLRFHRDPELVFVEKAAPSPRHPAVYSAVIVAQDGAIQYQVSISLKHSKLIPVLSINS